MTEQESKIYKSLYSDNNGTLNQKGEDVVSDISQAFKLYYEHWQREGYSPIQLKEIFRKQLELAMESTYEHPFKDEELWK